MSFFGATERTRDRLKSGTVSFDTVNPRDLEARCFRTRAYQPHFFALKVAGPARPEPAAPVAHLADVTLVLVTLLCKAVAMHKWQSVCCPLWLASRLRISVPSLVEDCFALL